MLIFTLGILDLWVALYLWVLQFGYNEITMVVFHSVYLFVKGLLFWGELYSIMDALIALYIIFLALGLSHVFITLVASLFLLQKSLFCLKG